MNASELLLTAKKIAESHVSSGTDLNDSITKIASEQSLSKNQIDRLVEETNKATFLELLEKKGEQEFPVASYETIKGKMTSKIEKNASENVKFGALNYSNSNFKTQVGENRISDSSMTKTASEIVLSEEGMAHYEALVKVATEIWTDYNTYLDLQALGQKRYGNNYNDCATLVKIASEHNDNEILQLKTIEASLIKQAAIFEVIFNKMEKVAGALWGELNPAKAALHAGGGIINRSANAAGAVVNLGTKAVIKGTLGLPVGAAKMGLKGAAFAAPVAVPFAMKHGVKNLNTTLSLATDVPRAIRGAGVTAKAKNFIGPGAMGMESLAMVKEAGVESLGMPLFQNALKWGGRALGVSNAIGKVTKNAVDKIGPGMTALASEGMGKDAGFMDGLQHALEFVTPAAVFGLSGGPIGVLGGIASAAAKKIGGGIALTMNKKEFENSFDTIMKNNPELAENKKQVRGYFDVVSRHAPSLAKDPLVAESIVKNMNAFGGVDYNTIRGLRETEAQGKAGPSEKGLSGLSAMMFGRS